MAYVASVAGELLLVEIETTPGSGTYGTPLLVNAQRSFDLMATTDTTVIPNATSQSTPGQTVRVTTALDWKYQGAGILNSGDDKTYADMLLLGTVRSVRISNTLTGGLVLTGPAIITAFQASSGGIGKKIDATITIEGAGIPTSTAHT